MKKHNYFIARLNESIRDGVNGIRLMMLVVESIAMVNGVSLIARKMEKGNASC